MAPSRFGQLLCHFILKLGNTTVILFPTPSDSRPFIFMLVFSPCSRLLFNYPSDPFLNRDKKNLPFTPILASVNRLIRYHLGTVAKGSFIITLVKIPRMILMYIHSQLKGKVGVQAGVWGWPGFPGSIRQTSFLHIVGY